jgi:nucleoside-diphosphate-sugar epimerase
LVYGDVTDYDSLVEPISKCEVVYHLAGLTAALSLEELLQVNEAGSLNVVKACAQDRNPPVLVVLSSLEAAGPSSDDDPRTELVPPAPITNYGKAKMAGEQAVVEFAEMVPTTIVRAPTVFGEMDRQALTIFKALRIAKLGIYPIPLRRGFRLSLIHAKDLATFLILIADQGERLLPQERRRDRPGYGVYYVGYGEHPTMVELLRSASIVLGERQARVVHLPSQFVWILALISEGMARLLRRPPDILNRDKAKAALAGSWTCSPLKARHQLGFAPAASLQQRLRQTANWYQQEGWL